MIVHRERAGDVAAVRALTVAAFREGQTEGQAGGREPTEAGLLDALRACDAWLPALSLVAVDPGGALAGHVLCTRGHVDGVPALGLGPLSVAPARQRQGVGTALVHAVLGAADALDEPLVALLGSPAYYGRFGFRPGGAHGVASPEPAWGEYFQVRTLSAHDPALRGTFRYAEPFAHA